MGEILESTWSHLGMILSHLGMDASSYSHLGLIFRVILDSSWTQLWSHLGVILESSWDVCLILHEKKEVEREGEEKEKERGGGGRQEGWRGE